MAEKENKSTIYQMNKYQYNLSIIIPAYNAARFIERTITEASQIVPTPEIIVVDDGSQDGTYHVCKGLQNKLSTLYVYTQKNAGVSAARNLGIKYAHGKWLFFCDSDDWVDVDGITRVLKIANEQKENTLMLAAMNFVKPDGVYLHIVPEKHNIKPHEYLASNNFQGSSCNHLFPKKLIKGNHIQFPIGVVNTEDSNFNIKAICCCDNICSVNIPIYNYNHLNEEACHKTNFSMNWRIGPLLSSLDIIRFIEIKGIDISIVFQQIDRLVEYYYRSHIYGKHTTDELRDISQLLRSIGQKCPNITISPKYKIMTHLPVVGICLLRIYNRIKFGK